MKVGGTGDLAEVKVQFWVTETGESVLKKLKVQRFSASRHLHLPPMNCSSFHKSTTKAGFLYTNTGVQTGEHQLMKLKFKVQRSEKVVGTSRSAVQDSLCGRASSPLQESAP